MMMNQYNVSQSQRVHIDRDSAESNSNFSWGNLYSNLIKSGQSNVALRQALLLGAILFSAQVGEYPTMAMVLQEPPKATFQFDSSAFLKLSLPTFTRLPDTSKDAISSIQIIRYQRLRKRMRPSQNLLSTEPEQIIIAEKRNALEWTRALFDEDIVNLDDVLQHDPLRDDNDIFTLPHSTHFNSNIASAPFRHTLTHNTVTAHLDVGLSQISTSTIVSSQEGPESSDKRTLLKPYLKQRPTQNIKDNNLHNTVQMEHISNDGDGHGDNGNTNHNNILRDSTTHEPNNDKPTREQNKDSQRQSFDPVYRINSKDISTLLAAKKNWIDSQNTQNTQDDFTNDKISITRTDALQETNEMKSKESLADTPHAKPKRLTQQEEIELGQIIQRGAHVHRIKAEFEQKHGRDITRSEWVQLAQLHSPKELRRLVSDYRLAKNTLVMANMGLVHGIVRNRLGRSWTKRGTESSSTSMRGNEYDEWIQEGSLGLLRAAELFDPTKGLRFSTYATIWIKGVLSNSSLGDTITLPLREKNKWNKIKKAHDDLIAENQDYQSNSEEYSPSVDEVAQKCGISKQEVVDVMSKMTRAKNVLSLDYQYDSTSRSGSDTVKFNALANDKNLMDDVDLVERLQLRADIVATLVRNLDRRESRLMKLRYGLDDGKSRSIAECAEEMGISKARAQQLAAGCLKKLREADDAESLQEYLLSL